MPITRDSSGKRSRFCLSGTLTVAGAESLAGELKLLLEQEDKIVLFDLNALESVDVSFFQLLISFQISLKRQERSLLLCPLPPGHGARQTAEILGLPWDSLFTFEEPSP